MLSKRTAVVSILLMLSFFKPFAQVNLQTGSAVFSLPMFNWQDDKSRLNSAVALNYSSGSGLKVNDMASNAGQGWNLAAGGVITRMQVGEPDDQIAYSGTPAYGNGSDQDLTKYPAGYLYLTAPNTPVSQGCPKALSNYPTYGSQGIPYAQHNIVGEDRQQDYFAFTFNGKSGIFMLDTANGGYGVPLGDTKLKIKFQTDPTMTNQGIRTTITSFTITDVDGLIYKFSLHGLTRLLKPIFSNADGTQSQGQPKIGNGGTYYQSVFDQGPTAAPWTNKYMANPYIITNWYLSEIDDPFTTRKITFTYNTTHIANNSAGSDITWTNGSEQYVVISYKKANTTTLDIASITYPDGHLVNFTYSPTPRYDYPGEYALSAVDITYNGRHVSQYQLNTSYFILNRYGTPTTEYQISVARLCLRSVRKIGVDLKEDSPPYLFDYYTGSNNVDDFVPPPFFYVKDIWGFYNGNNSIASNSPLTGSTIPVSLTASGPSQLNYAALKGLCFQNDNVTGTYYNAKPGLAQNGLLKQIVYPTGGSLVYQYTQNTGSFIGHTGTVLNVGGVHVSQTNSYDGGYSNGCATPVSTQYNYVMNGIGSASSLWGLETPVNSLASNNFWKEERQTIHFSWSHPFGECLWHYIYPGVLSQYEAVSIEGWQKIMAEIAPVLGVLSVIGTIDDVINLMASSGFLTIAAVVLDVISAILGYFFTCPQQTKNTYSTVFYNYDLNQGGPLPAQFKRVEITASSGNIGKTVIQYTHGDPDDPGGVDYALWFPAGSNTAFSAKQRFASWAYGLPRLTTLYDVNGNKIKETQNQYDFYYAKEEIGDWVYPPGQEQYFAYPQSCKCQVINSYSLRSDHWTDPNNYNALANFLTSSNGDITVDFYNLYTGRVLLDSTFERTYRVTDPSQFVQTCTVYQYNSDFRVSANSSNFDPFLVKVYQSNGDLVYKGIKYSSDYNSGVLATLVQKNLVSVPVATTNYIRKAFSPNIQYLGEKVTEYTQLANGDIKTSRILEQRFPAPVFTITPYSGPTTTNYANYKIPELFTYDVNGNRIGRQDEGGRTVTDIYDYNDKDIVANVINANPVLDKPAYTSFENFDLSRSGWTLSGIQSYNQNTLSVTGVNNLALLSNGGNSLSASSLNTATGYILSFWANNGNVTVTGGATLTKTGPTYNGFTYYEYNIVAGTSTVTLRDNTPTNANMDELRLYPVNARMITNTYDPLLGKTSLCDENNRIRYYTYDNLGRLQFIQDESHNIVKMYEYNNVSAAKQTGCPVSYGNHMISELVRRLNCGAGYLGGNATFTIPANSYTSSISQQDADVQAENLFFTNAQTYANTNGSCSLIYHNVAEAQTDTSKGCGTGLLGGTVTYTVPANTYSSIISQADANQQALDDITANAQAYANDPSNAVCNVDTAADWEWNPGDASTPADPSYCLSVNGQLPPHLFIKLTDINPHSPTYNQTEWQDDGPNNACPANTYYNASQSGVFYKNNCSGGGGLPITYTVAPGTYNSTVSQAAADQLATNDITANGQNYANANGTCCTPAFSFAAGLSTIVNQNSMSSATTVNFTWVFNYPSGGPTSINLGTVTSSCSRPTGTRTIPFIVGSTTFNVSISPSGQVTLQVVSGPTPTTNSGVACSGSYDLNQNAFYSAAESGSFTRNNCSAGQTGSTVTYSVQAYAYHSLISQADANQQAINAVNAGGQNYANANGTCSTNCSFTWNSSITNHLGNTISSTATTGSISLTFVPSTSGYTGGTLGTIVGVCHPSITRSFMVTDGANSSRTWNVTVTSTGSVSISLATGPAATNSFPPVVINGTYNL